MTEEVGRIFKSEYVGNRPYEFQDNVHLQITFEFDLTLYRIDRNVYSTLDWIGDVGGLSEGLYIILNILLGLFQYKALEHFLIERLFLKPKLLRDGTRNLSKGPLFEPLQADKTRLCR